MTINIYRSTHRDLSRGRATESDAEIFQSETFWDRAIINTVFELWGFDLVRVTLETEGTEVVCLIASGWQPNDWSKGSRLKFQIHSGELDTLNQSICASSLHDRSPSRRLKHDGGLGIVAKVGLQHAAFTLRDSENCLRKFELPQRKVVLC